MTQDEHNPTNLPAWQAHQRLLEAKIRELHKKAPPLKAEMASFIRDRGVDFGTDLHIGFTLDMAHIGFDAWYQTDEELERDKSSGRREEIAHVLRSAARTCAKASSEVRFHSHQFVREKYGGDYFAYLR